MSWRKFGGPLAALVSGAAVAEPASDPFTDAQRAAPTHIDAAAAPRIDRERLEAAWTEGVVVNASADAFSEGPTDLAADYSGYTPRVAPTRIDTAAAPRIDGDLSDAAWAEAAVIDAFLQVLPVEGAEPSQRTRALLMYDERHLYVAIYAYDDEPEKIVRNLLERDPRLQDDDGVRILIDSFGTNRDSYFFGTNANGARLDALTENNSTFRGEWNTIWDVKAKVVEDGWIAEFAIPFQSIAFDASLDDWGFQIVRTIRRNNEEIRWSNISRSRGRLDLTNPGKLSGIKGIKTGRGLEAQLFVTGATRYDWELDETNTDLNPSANIFYKITPSLTGSLTFNTDFADAPLDERQVNTGRFSLFFPETRDFFLQDAAVFEFGGRAFSEQPNGQPFFSRNIGVVDGRPVDIVAGGKLSGIIGPASIGALVTRTGPSDAVDGQFLSATRVSVPVLRESKAGLVFTYGDPEGAATNAVAGADFQYKNSSVLPGTVTADFAYQRSFDDGVEDDIGTAHLAYRSDAWNGDIRAQSIGEDYRPRLGFVNRVGVNRTNGSFWRSYRPQNSVIRIAETGVFTGVVADSDYDIVDRFVGGWARAENDIGDSVFAEIERGFEDVTEPFNLAGEVPVPMARYKFTRQRVEARLSSSRPFSAGVEVGWGTIFGGDTYDIELQLGLKPSRHFRLEAEYSYTDFSLPAGDIGIHVGVLGATIAFTPRMSLKTDIQYDNISENFTYFSRFLWEPRPQQEVFLSLGHSATIDRETFPRDFRSLGSNFAVRLGHTLRL